MSYCTNCGQGLQPSARFCTSCGTPIELAVGSQPVTSSLAGSAGPAGPSGPAPTVTAPQPGQQPAAAQRAVSAFSSVPVSDYARDVVAVLLLLFSLFMVWTFGAATRGSVAASRVDVILITLVSIFSVTLPYLWRSGVFGPSWGYRRTQLARLAANAPYAVLAVVYLVLELVNHQGLGPAMAFGLAGAFLAAQPRRAELGSAPTDAAVDRRWATAVAAFALAVGVLTVVQIIERLTLVPTQDWSTSIIAVLLGAGNAGLLLWCGVGVLRGNGIRRQIGVGIGVAGLAVGLLALLPGVTVASMFFSAYTPGATPFFWVAFGVLAAAPSADRFCRETTGDGATPLMRTRTIVTLAIAVAGLLLVVAALVLVGSAAYPGGYGSYFNPVTWVVTIFLAAVAAVGGVVLRAALKQQTRQSYVLTAGYSGLLFIVGLVVVIMTAVSSMLWTGMLALILAFVFPAALILSMFGTASQREAFRSLGSGGQLNGFSFDAQAASVPANATGAEMPSQGEQAWSEEACGTPQLASQPQPVDHILAEAANPATPAARLSELAAQYPHARTAIAANPAAYPALLEWLAERNDSEIAAALAHRGK